MALGVVALPREAWVSGSAQFAYIEPEYLYSFKESTRKILRNKDYDSYFAGKRRLHKSVMKLALPQLQAFIAQLRAAKIAIVPLVLDQHSGAAVSRSAKDLVEQSQRGALELALEGSKGRTQILLQLKMPISGEQAALLLRLAKAVQFEALHQMWTKNNSPSAAETDFVDGLTLPRFYSKYSLALTLPAIMRAKELRYFEAAMRRQLTRVAPTIARGFAQHLKRKIVWVDPRQLVSMRVHKPKLYQRALTRDPYASIFNPFGPLFDGVGRRSSARSGLLTYSMLFVSNKPWNDHSPYASNRAGFESWLQQIVRGPKHLRAEAAAQLQRAFANDKESQRYIEGLVANPHLRELVGQRVIAQLVGMALDGHPDRLQSQLIALKLLRNSTGPERKKVLVELVRREQFSKKMAVLSQLASDVYDAKVVRLLIGVMGHRSASEDDKRWAKNALQTIRNVAKRRKQTRLVRQISVALGTTQ